MCVCHRLEYKNKRFLQLSSSIKLVPVTNHQFGSVLMYHSRTWRRAEVIDFPLSTTDFAFVFGRFPFPRFHRKHLHFLLEAELFGHWSTLVLGTFLLFGQTSRSRVSVDFLGTDNARRCSRYVWAGVGRRCGGCQHRFSLSYEAIWILPYCVFDGQRVGRLCRRLNGILCGNWIKRHPFPSAFFSSH